MESCKEFEGRDIESAVQNACDALGLSRNDIKYEIISRGATGVFGFIGVRKARVKVFPPDAPGCDQGGGRPPNGDVTLRNHQAVAAAIVDEAFNDGDSTSSVPDDLLETATTALTRIVDFIVEDASIHAAAEKDRIVFNLKCGNSGVLIGKRGQTLEAIQYLMDKIVNKKSETRIRVQVDVEGYVQNRTNNLTRLAQRMAEKAKKTGKPATINQMNAYDRRIVHLALKDDGEVKTQSMGDGYYRKLVIFPKRGGGRKPRQSS